MASATLLAARKLPQNVIRICSTSGNNNVFSVTKLSRNKTETQKKSMYYVT